jgi:hypothetical protein
VTRYWDDTDGVWIEGESYAFTGPQAQYTLVDGTGWRQRDVTQYLDAMGFGDLPQAKHLKGKGNADTPFGSRLKAARACACGTVLKGSTAWRCGSCAAKERPKETYHVGHRTSAMCRGCGRSFLKKLFTDKLQLCPTWKPGRQRAVRFAA